MAEEYTVKNNDFSSFDDSSDFTLERIDRNNTHYYISKRCPKCGGKGYIPGYEYVDGGVCFMCGGSGRGHHQVIVRTKEYKDKLDARRLERAKKRAPEKNAQFLQHEGFSPDGKTYVVLGDTYSIRAELKEAGAKYNNIIGWHFAEPNDQYLTKELTKDTVVYKSETSAITLLITLNDGTLTWAYEYAIDYIKALQDEYTQANKSETHYFGEVGKRITRELTFIKLSSYQTSFGTIMIYNFADADGNTFIWKTSRGFYDSIEVGTVLTVKATIKEHNEYKGVKQTVLTRCKLLYQ